MGEDRVAVVRGDELGEAYRRRITEVYVRGFVATEPAHQGRGVGTALLRHLLALPVAREYVLEDIKDTNLPALGLYEKLGFAVYRRRKVRMARAAGFTELVSMRLEQPAA